MTFITTLSLPKNRLILGLTYQKKLELLQVAVLNPKFIIFDEIDTGVDVDALKTIAQFMEKNKKGKTYLLITHYNRILKYVKPDEVLVMMEGKIVKQGDYKLAEKIERDGYNNYETNKHKF